MDVESLFFQVCKSFPEVAVSLREYNKRSFMLSHPYKRVIYYNKNEVAKFSRGAILGAFAHELAHQVQYKKMSWFARLFFLRRYKANSELKRAVERAADQFACRRGFAKELLLLQREYQTLFGTKRFKERIAPFHLSEKEIKKLV